MTTAVPGFPNTFQTDYTRMPKAGLPGTYWEGELHTQRPAAGLIAKVTEVPYAATVTIAAFNAGDEVGITVKGVDVVVTAVTDATATAALLNVKINAAELLAGVLSSTVAGPALTLAGALGADLNSTNVVEYSPDTTTSAITGVTNAVVQQKILFGMAVVKNVPSTGTNFNKIRLATSASDIFAGVIAYTPASDIPPEQILASGFNPNYLMPGQTYVVERENCGLYVEYVGDAPTETDSVYRIFTGTNSGLWRKTDGGTSEAVTLTLVTVAADTFAMNYDGLPDLTFTANGTEAADCATLTALWNASALYSAIGTMTDGAGATVTIAFNDRSTHVLTDNSTGGTSVSEVVDTAAVAATAVLVPGYSWGAPSITTDLPARARLRLANP